MRRILFLALPLAALIGCGPSKADIAQSRVNQLAESWDGTDKFTPEGMDPWGEPYSAKVEKGDVNFNLTVRSNGPDKLPFTKDDVTAKRSVQHTPVSKVIAPGVERISEAVGKGLGRGGVSGLKEGLTGKKKDEDQKDAPKKDAENK